MNECITKCHDKISIAIMDYWWIHEKMDEWIDEWMNWRKDGWMNDEWMDSRKDGWMNGRMNGFKKKMDKRIDE